MFKCYCTQRLDAMPLSCQTNGCDAAVSLQPDETDADTEVYECANGHKFELIIS